MSKVSYFQGAERPSVRLWWYDDTGALIDLTGYTFTLRIGTPGSAALVTKTNGITGATGAGTPPSGTPNVTVAWDAGDLAIPSGLYTGQLTATSGGLDRVLQFQIDIKPAIT